MVNKILAPTRRIGAINFKKLEGGDLDLEELTAIKIANSNPRFYYCFSSKALREYGVELKRNREVLRKGKVSIRNGVIKVNKNFDSRIKELDDKIKKVYRVLNSRVKRGPRFNFDNIEIVSMTNQKNDYEIKDKVIKMKYPKVETEEHIFRHDVNGKIIYRSVVEENIIFGDKSRSKDDTSLTQKDIISLYFSKRICLNQPDDDGKDNYVPVKDILEEKNFKASTNEADILPYLNFGKKSFRVEIGDTFVRLDAVKRAEFVVNDATNKMATSFLLNLKGDMLVVKNKKLHYYDKLHKRWENTHTIGYNNLNYEDNKIIVFGTEDAIKSVKSTFKRVNHVDNGYYDFSKDGGKVGLNKLRKEEENHLKSYKRPGLQGYSRNEFSNDASDIIDIVSEISEEVEKATKITEKLDGRLSCDNLEHVLRNDVEMKTLLSETSSKLFFLHREIENSTPERLGISEKKHIALKNVLLSFKHQKELEEEETEYLTEQLDEDVERRKTNNFLSKDNYKTHRNYYNQTIGVLAQNGNPQTTHRRRSNPPSMGMIRSYRKENKVDLCKGRFAGVSDSKTLSQIYPDHKEDVLVTLHKKCYGAKRAEVEVETLPLPLLETLVLPLGAGSVKFINGFEVSRNPLDEEYILDLLEEIEGYLPKETVENIRSEIMFGYRYLGPATEYEAELPKKVKEDLKDNKVMELVPQKGKVQKIVVEEGKEPKIVFENKNDKLGFNSSFYTEHYVPSVRTNKDFFDLVRGVTQSKVAIPSPTLKVGSYPTNTCVEEFYQKLFSLKGLSGDMKGIYIPSPTPSKVKVYKSKETLKKEGEMNRIIKNRYEIINQDGDVYKIKIVLDGEIKEVYAKGNLKALKGESISYAGIRKPAKETIDYINRIVELHSQRYVIVSGLAEGCDTFTHSACLDNGGITIAVLPCGFDNIYPKVNKNLAKEILNNQGLLLSEYPPEKEAGWTVDKEGRSQMTFHERNRIIAGLSGNVVIFEAGEGTKNTYYSAVVQNKKIFVQPCKRNKGLKSRGV